MFFSPFTLTRGKESGRGRFARQGSGEKEQKKSRFRGDRKRLENV
jgi:hypothetical protein